ncbi:MAG: S8/S53 family peptidase [Flavobacteriales bacterium]|nr:S8/S53 family peptidase [Flavobacteriales bacterium]MDG2245244.1 S8/S53 family peptidase [Flavobacteriales bacterium]
MKNRLIVAFSAMALVVTSCQKEASNDQGSPSVDLSYGAIPRTPDAPVGRAEINQEAQRQLEENGVVKWELMSDELLWSAVVQSDSLVSIGYQPTGFAGIEDKIHLINVKDGDWKAVKNALVGFVLEEANRLNPDRNLGSEDVLAFGEKELPYFNARITDFETLAKLRRMGVVRYVEPMGYGTEATPGRSSAGCGDNGPQGGLVNGVDYDVISPNAKVSWNYEYSNIEEAWNESTGDGITIGLIDTGVSSGQDKLNNEFSSGYSTGRYIDKVGFHESCWWWWCSNDGVYDDCGHGTSMAGTIAGPRTNEGSSVGVAYNANLVSCRGTDDVIINSSNEKDGVSDSYYYLGNRSDVKIISMSLGDVFYSGQVADAVNYANNQGKLIFCAAGTSLSWTSWWGVIFPANMSQTVAVTGVKTGLPMARCVECHSGSQVDFIVVMQDRNNTNRGPITLSDYGNTPNYTGGSSIATATTAGIAALVWAENPGLSKNQVTNILKENASYYPYRNGQFGWGIIDAAAAVDDAN